MASSGVGGRGDGNHGNKETRSQFEPADEQHELLSKPGYFKFMGYFPKRYIVGIMAFFGFCNIYALRVNLSVAIVAMTSNHTQYVNGSKLIIMPDFHWDSHLKGLILGSFFYGYIFTQLPGDNEDSYYISDGFEIRQDLIRDCGVSCPRASGKFPIDIKWDKCCDHSSAFIYGWIYFNFAGYLATKFGGKYLFGGGIFLTAIFTLLTPLCARWNVYLLITVRVLEGLFEGVTYPSIHAIWAKWAPPLEKTRLATLAFSGSYFGTVISLPVSGALAQSYAGWPSIFYVFGSIAVLWFLLWCLLVAESPAKHPSISNKELEYIQGSIGYTDEQTQNLKPPWRCFLTSLPVWAIVAAHFSENWGFYTWLTELPSFMNDVLHFDMYQAGFLAAVPYLVMAIVVQGCGHLADFLRGRVQVSTEAVRKIFTCGAFFCQIVFMIAAGYTRSSTACMVCLTFAVGLGGFAWGGFSVNHLDIAPQFASILMGLSNTFATIPGIVSPGLTGLIITRKGDPAQWQIIFYIAAGVYLFGAVIYGIFASGNRQKWAEVATGYMSYRDGVETEQDEN